MGDDLEFRKVGDRIITEKQYQSEQNTQELLDTAGSFSAITMPASWIAGLGFFVYSMYNGWSDINSSLGLLFSVFLNGLLGFIVGFAVYMFMIPALLLGAIVLVCLFADKLFFNNSKQTSLVQPQIVSSTQSQEKLTHIISI